MRSKFILVVLKCILLLSLTLTSLTLWAQQDSSAFQPQLLIGAQYGLSWNTMRFSPSFNEVDFLPGTRYGLVGRYVEAPNLGVQVELSYDQRGWIERRDTLPSTFEQQIDYIDLGLFSHFSIGKGAVRPIILLGSFLSVPISDSRKLPTDWTVVTPTYYDEELEGRFQYGLSGGIGVQADLGPLMLQLSGRYRYALSNVFRSGEGTSFTFSQSNGFLVGGTLFWKM